MRTRELLGRLHRQLSLTRSGKDKQFLIDLCARIEQAELDLRRYRLTGERLVSGSLARAQGSRLEALLREGAEGNAQKGLPGPPGVPNV